MTAMVLALLAAGTAPAGPASASGGTPEATREVFEAGPGARIYRVDTGRSWAMAKVHPAGPFGGAGHAHTVASRELTGCVLRREDGGGRVEVVVPAASLAVDAARDRRRAGEAFAAPVPAEDAEATRENLLGPEVLHRARHPRIRLSGRLPAAPGEHATLGAALTVRGRSVDLDIPLRLAVEAGEMRARGRFSVQQTAFGIEPYSVLLGALRVRDRLDFELLVVADRLPDGARCTVPGSGAPRSE